MKALFITNCGCSKMMDIPQDAYEYLLPLVTRFNSTSGGTEPLDYKGPETRKFKRFAVEYINNIPVLIFKEVDE